MTATVAIAGLAWNRYRQSVQLASDVGSHVAAADAFLESADYAAGDRELADARGHMETADYGAGPLAEEVDRLTNEFAAKQQAIEQFDQFQQLRHRIHSEMYAVDQTILGQAQEHCRAALDLFGVFEDDPWKSQADFREPRHRASSDARRGSRRTPLHLGAAGDRHRATHSLRPNAPRVIAGRSRLWKRSRRLTRTSPRWPSGWPTAGQQSATRRQPRRPAREPSHFNPHPPRTITCWVSTTRSTASRTRRWPATGKRFAAARSLPVPLGRGRGAGRTEGIPVRRSHAHRGHRHEPADSPRLCEAGISRLGQRKILLAQADFRQAAETRSGTCPCPNSSREYLS